jgi:hypothetical protein
VSNLLYLWSNCLWYFCFEESCYAMQASLELTSKSDSSTGGLNRSCLGGMVLEGGGKRWGKGVGW